MGLSVMCPLLKYSEKVSNKICIYFTSGGISYASLSGSAGKSVLSVTPSCGKPSSFCSCKQSRNTTAWDRFPLRLIWNITHHFPLPIKTLCGLMWLMKYWTRYTIRYTISSASGLRENTKGIENLPTVRNKSEKARKLLRSFYFDILWTHPMMTNARACHNHLSGLNMKI